ncbi:hypothetical protein METBIDRAFT_114661 [Metschnikowia bicuspidata var. bicuspidata NRRL YB-4993]|uniref:Transcription factor IIIC 90kDa subunit N-terminal domain-containing protein n=1 Tax=Metschnikowia bicuspidata var. bicuspidata NRRL YB-4993 TaxID=869754 RepID=A0A1A0HI89_9ASCO|nr:hypothetical protein METBIDRAFT_114661 [Metschnikowia bicuspidata var. bicuspidata NRRL YB-4993]OBA23884.1 hypothetical protein METBIDRAFT_114661 [Metschnikowia bicuspidata var. bicuspidata NRRL YB-4993]
MRLINVLRATIGNGILEPVKCSENMQLAINTSNHITILEPKLPLLHCCIEPPAVEGDPSTIDPTAFFDVRSTFHIESLESLGFQVFSRIIIEDSENIFNFGRISEPMIVGHAWSPIELCTRDCYLGVLLNTGEMMVLKRDSLDANNYSMKYRSFSCILDQMSLLPNRHTSEGDIILTGDQFLELKVTAFSFGKAPDGSLILVLAHESKAITIHHLTDKLPQAQRVVTEDLAVKLIWSSTGSELYYVLRDNSVWGCKFDVNLKLQTGPTQIKLASRFLVSHIQFHDSRKFLIITDTAALYVGSLEFPCVSTPLPYNSMLVNLSTIDSDSHTTVLLPFESGCFSVAKINFSSRDVEMFKQSSVWEAFHHQTLHKYQAQLQKEQNKALSKAFLPYLVDAMEGQIAVHGFLPLLSSGFAAVVYSLTPKNVITHTIKSRKEFNVGFVPIKGIAPIYDLEHTHEASALSYLSSVIICEKDKFPPINKGVRDGIEDASNDYISKLRQWKMSKFEEPSSISLSVTPKSDLRQSIIENFRENSKINKLQKHYLLNVSLAKSLRGIKTQNGRSYDIINQELEVIAGEQDIISTKIRTQLASIVVLWASAQLIKTLDSSLDSFFLSTYRSVLRQSDMTPTELPIPERVKLTISTDLCTEMFETSEQEVISSLNTVMSSSKHSWPRCDMTLLPILDLSNKMDELENHNYMSARRDESNILSIMFGCLDFCIYTGTRTFDMKVGL